MNRTTYLSGNLSRHLFRSNRMTHVVLLAAVAALASSSASPAQDVPAGQASSLPRDPGAVVPATMPSGAATQSSLPLRRRLFPGSAVSIEVPAEWKRAYWGPAFVAPEIKAQISFVEVPFPFQAARRGIEPGGPLVQGYTIDRRESITVQDRDGVLARGTRSINDTIETRYFLCFGTSVRSIYIAMSFPSDQDKVYEPAIKSIIGSINWTPENPPNLSQRFPYDFTPPPGMKQSGLVNGRLVFNESGKRAIDINEAFMFVISNRRDGKGVLEKAEFQTNLENSIGKDKKLKITDISKARFGDGTGENARVPEGWDGWGTVNVPQPTNPEPSGAPSPASKVPTAIAVYLAQFYDEKGDALYTFFGQCPSARSGDMIPLFKASLKTLKMRSNEVLEAETEMK